MSSDNIRAWFPNAGSASSRSRWSCTRFRMWTGRMSRSRWIRKSRHMMRDLLMDDRMKGQAAGIFFLGYVLLQMAGGHLAGKWSAKKLVSLCLIFWGVCAVGCGLAKTFYQFEIARFLLGVSESCVFPATWFCWRTGFPAPNARAPTPFGICASRSPSSRPRPSPAGCSARMAGRPC